MTLHDLEQDPEWQAWKASRPAHIQRAIENFPPGTEVDLHGEHLYLLGWSETNDPKHVMLIFSAIDPSQSEAQWANAQRPEHKRYVCECHLIPDAKGSAS